MGKTGIQKRNEALYRGILQVGTDYASIQLKTK